MNEEWRYVPGDDIHQVSNLGRVRSMHQLARWKRGGGIIAPYVSPWSNHICVLLYNPYLTIARVANLVALAWLGPCPLDHEVRHIDGRVHNNQASNLRYEYIP